MTLLGKVFTAILCVLSVIFFTLAVVVNSTHIDYRSQVENPTNGFKKRVADSEQKNQNLTQELDQTKSELAREQAARRSALASLQEMLEKREAELSEKDKELTTLLSGYTIKQATLNQTVEELKAKTADNETLRKQIVDARNDRNQLYDRLVKTIDEYNRLQGMYQVLDERWRDTADKFSSAKEKLDILNIKENTMLDAPPPVNGEVLAVATNGLVEVSLGRDDGMREGFTLEVHRNGQYLGRLKVRTVADDKSVAEILTSYQRGYIRAGDRVDSKLL